MAASTTRSTPAPRDGSRWGGEAGDGRFDPRRTEGAGLRDSLRAFRTAALLGWKIEANWTDPLLFFIYSVAKPLAGALILLFMVRIISGDPDPAYQAFVVTGSALWAFVTSGVAGLAWSILDDRERYRMLRYLVVSPADLVVLLLGRGVARLAIGGVASLITITVGVLFLGVPFDPARVHWPLLVAAMALGVVALMGLALLLAGTVMQTRQDSWSYPQAVAGAMFLLVGAVFPLAVLPAPAQALGLLLPLTWWLTAVREALFPDGVSALGGEGSLWVALSGRPEPTVPEMLLALLLTGAVATLAAVAVYRASEHRAKDRGLFDQTTGS